MWPDNEIQGKKGQRRLYMNHEGEQIRFCHPELGSAKNKFFPSKTMRFVAFAFSRHTRQSYQIPKGRPAVGNKSIRHENGNILA